MVHIVSTHSHALWDNFNERVPRERLESNAAAAAASAATPIVVGEVEVQADVAIESSSGWRGKFRCCRRGGTHNQVTNYIWIFSQQK